MSERIRYRKNTDGALQSVQTFLHPSNGAQYKVVLNPETSQWSVQDATTSLSAATGHNPLKHKAQLEARAALASLGVELNTEKRKERTKKASATV